MHTFLRPPVRHQHQSAPRLTDHGRIDQTPHNGNVQGKGRAPANRLWRPDGTNSNSTKGSAMPQVTLTVNGKQHTVDVEGRTLLVELLREKLGLTGTHVGCDTSQCGACVVHVNNEAVKSCTMLALQADGTSVTTIEGLAAPDGTLHPMQEMFREHHALQCGFCTPGMVMTAIDLVNAHPSGLTEKEIREGLEGNLCRCTGYHNIVKAIAAAHPLMHTKAAE
jgi:carbon-monoxide dehydrogenase small subunit